MPKMLAQANRKLVWVPAGGIDDVHAPTVAELTAVGVIDLSCLVTKADYNLGPTGDTEINDPALCAEGDSSLPGNTQYEAAMNFFRNTVSADDDGWTTFTGKGIDGFLVERIGAPKSYTIAFVALDKVRVFGSITGSPQMLPVPTDGGFEKFRQVFHVQSELVDERAVVAA